MLKVKGRELCLWMWIFFYILALFFHYILFYFLGSAFGFFFSFSLSRPYQPNFFCHSIPFSYSVCVCVCVGRQCRFFFSSSFSFICRADLILDLMVIYVCVWCIYVWFVQLNRLVLVYIVSSFYFRIDVWFKLLDGCCCCCCFFCGAICDETMMRFFLK